MYTPGYLTYLDQNGQPDGWPQGVTELAKRYCTGKLRGIRMIYMDLESARLLIFRPASGTASVPQCLKEVALLDAQYAIAYRALLAVSATPLWRLP